jgi:hypothetical protein
VQRALLILLIAVSYLLLAGGPRWTLAAIAALVALCLLASPGRRVSFPSSTRGLDIALVALAVAVALQCVPLPAAVVAVLSPEAQPVRADLRFVIGPPQQWLPLSLDPQTTAYGLANLLLAIGTFWAARTAFAGGGVRRFCRIIGVLAAIAALIAVVQRAATPKLVLGLVRPEALNASPMGPFLNRNHFAAWQLMAAAITTGYIVAHLHIHPVYRASRFRGAFKHFLTSGALLSGLGVLAMIGSLLMTLSRSAAVALGAAFLSAGWLGRPRLRVERTALPALASVAGVALLLIALLIDVDGWLSRLQLSMGMETSEQWGRLTIWRESLPIIHDFWLAGTGAGTFGLAMEHYQQSRVWVGAMQGWAHFNNAHSHYVQLAAEGGLLLSIPALAAIVLLARAGLQAIRAEKAEIFWVRIGAAAGLVGIAVQGIWEVPLVMPANGVLSAVLAGLLLHRREVRRGDGTEMTLTPDKLAG